MSVPSSDKIGHVNQGLSSDIFISPEGEFGGRTIRIYDPKYENQTFSATVEYCGRIFSLKMNNVSEDKLPKVEDMLRKHVFEMIIVASAKEQTVRFSTLDGKMKYSTNEQKGFKEWDPSSQQIRNIDKLSNLSTNNLTFSGNTATAAFVEHIEDLKSVDREKNEDEFNEILGKIIDLAKATKLEQLEDFQDLQKIVKKIKVYSEIERTAFIKHELIGFDTIIPPTGARGKSQSVRDVDDEDGVSDEDEASVSEQMSDTESKAAVGDESDSEDWLEKAQTAESDGNTHLKRRDKANALIRYKNAKNSYERASTQTNSYEQDISRLEKKIQELQTPS